MVGQVHPTKAEGQRVLQELGEERMQRQSLEIQLQSFRNAGFKDPEVTAEQDDPSHAMGDFQIGGRSDLFLLKEGEQ